MSDVTKKSFIICMAVISLLAGSAGLHAIVTHDSGALRDQTGNAAAMDAANAGRVPQKADQEFNFRSKTEVYELLFGLLLAIIGLATIALFFLRWRPRDFSLISFGIFCVLSGARTSAFQFLFDAPLQFLTYSEWFITYLIPIPIYIFAEQIVGKGWKSSIRRLWQIQIIFAVVAISVGIYQHDPAAAMVANNIFVTIAIVVIMANMFRPGLRMNRELRVLRAGFLVWGLFALHANIAPLLTEGYESPDLEGLGFLIFICCLGYLVAHRFFQNEKELIMIAHELETARQIQSFILPQETVKVKGLQLAARYVPMASVAGDFYDFTKGDEKVAGILVADVSGHGVPASLIGSMVKIAFASQLPHASDPARVLAGINQILCGKLESDFVTAGYLYIDTEQQTASYAGAGHPPLLLWRPSEQQILEFREKGIILGQFEDTKYETTVINLERGDRFFLYTDGIVEASNPTGDIFGWDRLKSFIVSNSGLTANQFADKLIGALSRWSGKIAEDTLDDDLTLIVVDVETTGK